MSLFTKEELINETSYHVAKHISKTLLKDNLITKKEYELIIKDLINSYKPIIDSLLTNNGEFIDE